MSVSLIEVLQNARHNLDAPIAPFQKALGLEQLDNAIILLEAGIPPNADFDEDQLAKVKAAAEDQGVAG